MSLGVTIVDNTSEKILNEGGINYGVLIDDTITIIKEKILLLHVDPRKNLHPDS